MTNAITLNELNTADNETIYSAFRADSAPACPKTDVTSIDLLAD